jgi:hypothetical protein
MKISLLLSLLVVSSLASFGHSWDHKGFEHQIRGFLKLADSSIIIRTDDLLLRSTDEGETWHEVRLPISSSFSISSLEVFDDETLTALASDEGAKTVELLRSTDNGVKWSKQAITLPDFAFIEADISEAKLSIAAGVLSISVRIPTSSNFIGRVVYESHDDGATWALIEKTAEMNDNAAEPSVRDDIRLETVGTCAGFKSGCIQESKLLIGGKDKTPPQIKERFLRAKALVAAEARPLFALPPGGSTRISLNRGFDKCQASSVANMQLWWDNSYFHDTNIYFSGRARACPTQPFTNNPAWIDAVSAQGWGLIPTVVGYQAPCSVSSTPHKFSSVPATAETQGRGEADIAVADAQSIGLTAGSVLYYDMERYNDPGDGTCSTATIAFLKGWTERIHELGYVSGVYGSPTNAVPDWWPMPAGSRMDAIWMARWDNVMSVWVYNSPSPAFPAGAWADHQRIKQWQAPHNETWGGVTFNIDGNIADGPVAGIVVPRNKNADFDGDGKSDISVYRPDTGAWYALLSSNSGFSAVAFGLPTDIPVPGDYDGDGKTDRAVFRPSDNVWHILTKGNIYTGSAFGAAGDIPAAADYNGDGKTDLAVFRPSTGTWYIANSDSPRTVSIVQFGLSGDKPVPADYDGDGKTDIAIFRPNGATGGEWWIQRSSLGLFATQFGSANDKPVQGDYTGDGKTDIAIFTPSSGFWSVLRSEDFSYFAFPFGVSGDIPSSADFDGDGKFDVSVFRPAEGIWYISRSTAGILITQFGANGDNTVPAAYFPQ